MMRHVGMGSFSIILTGHFEGTSQSLLKMSLLFDSFKSVLVKFCLVFITKKGKYLRVVSRE